MQIENLKCFPTFFPSVVFSLNSPSIFVEKRRGQTMKHFPFLKQKKKKQESASSPKKGLPKKSAKSARGLSESFSSLRSSLRSNASSQEEMEMASLKNVQIAGNPHCIFRSFVGHLVILRGSRKPGL
jgi:hypothetical protein